MYFWGRFGFFLVVFSIMVVFLVILVEGRLVEFVFFIGVSGMGVSSISECLCVVMFVV